MAKGALRMLDSPEMWAMVVLGGATSRFVSGKLLGHSATAGGELVQKVLAGHASAAKVGSSLAAIAAAASLDGVAFHAGMNGFNLARGKPDRLDWSTGAFVRSAATMASLSGVNVLHGWQRACLPPKLWARAAEHAAHLGEEVGVLTGLSLAESYWRTGDMRLAKHALEENVQFLLAMRILGGARALASSRASTQQPLPRVDMDETQAPRFPREINSKATYESMVKWIHDDLIIAKKAPGFVVGLSGTDSIVTYLALAEAFKRAGRPERVAGIHFGPELPSRAELADPLVRDEFWFQLEVLPWLRKRAPGSPVEVDSTIDHRIDGLRWGALVEYSVTKDRATRMPRKGDDRFWVAGTRNASEEALRTYSNCSTVASVQPISNLWKSEVLQLSRDLGVPEPAIDRSCQVDCKCGRDLMRATYISEIDAILMVRQGSLAPEYLEATMPAELRVELEKYVDNLVAAGEFKERIPYLSQAPVAAHEGDNVNLLNAQEALARVPVDPRALSSAVPSIVRDARASVAADLAGTSSTDVRAWLPEALALYNTPGLLSSQIRKMNENILGVSGMKPRDFARLAQLNASVGNYGFSFPQWRFPSQRYGGGRSLAEQFGMTRLERANDVKDPSLPPSNPGRDQYGPGYVLENKDWYIEYRRAYIVVSRKGPAPATLIIRNSSHFFGRDRLRDAAYASTEKVDSTLLKNLDQETLEKSGLFRPWNRFFAERDSNDRSEAIGRMTSLVGKLDELNSDFGSWMLRRDDNGNFDAWLSFLREQAARTKRTGSPGCYVGVVSGNSSSWNPQNVKPVDDNLVRQLETTRDPAGLLGLRSVEAGRPVMLSGAGGDYP